MADEDINKGTAGAGSVPDQDGAKGGLPNSQGANSGSPAEEDEKSLPFNQHPKWQSARKTEKAVNDLLQANDLDNFEELVDLLQTGKAVKGKGVDVQSIEQALEDSKTLSRYRAYWAEQKEKQQREGEEPEQTIARLEREKADLKNRQKRDRESQEEVEQSKKALQGFSRTVTDYVKNLDTVPEDLRPHLQWMAGVGNDFAEVDITDPKAVKRMMQGVTKRWGEIEKLVIDNYLKQKGQPPRVPTPAGSTSTDATKDKTFKLREARKALGDAAMKAFAK